jgi:hypothetical protein
MERGPGELEWGWSRKRSSRNRRGPGGIERGLGENGRGPGRAERGRGEMEVDSRLERGPLKMDGGKEE